MSISKDNKTDIYNSNDMTKKNSLPLIVGTGALIFASVMSYDVNATAQINSVLNNNLMVYSQNSQANANSQDDDTNSNDKKKTSNKTSCYLKNDSGELFYDDDIEDDLAYYGQWDTDNYDDEEDFIIW